MKKQILFFLLICLLGIPLLMMACTPADIDGSATTADTKANTLPETEATSPKETTAENPSTEATETNTEAAEPDTEAVTTAPDETDPIETEPLGTEDTEAETVPSYVSSYLNGAEKLAELLDYSDGANWIARPDNPDKPVDVFFLYPTFYGATTGYAPDDVADINNLEMRLGAEQLSLKGQASVFQDVCNIYMPAYRQVTVTGLMRMLSSDSVVQYYLSRDVYRSLDYYFENYNNGKPFILAGHSQGSIWITEILENYMREHPEYMEQTTTPRAVSTWASAKPTSS